MQKKNRRLFGWSRTAWLVILGLALFAPALGAAHRQGTRIVVTKVDKTVIRGELLAVMDENLILMDELTRDGITVNLRDVRRVKAADKSNTLKGIGIGLISGAVLGAALGATSQEEESHGSWSRGYIHIKLFTREQMIFGGGLVFGALGAAAGGLITGSGKEIAIVLLTPESTKKTISCLRRLAREKS